MNPLNCKHIFNNKFIHLGIKYTRCSRCRGVKKVESDNENNNSTYISYYSGDNNRAVDAIGEYVGRHNLSR